MIELDGRLVPVIDANARLGAGETPIGNCSCIVVIEHGGISERHCSGILVQDIDEVMQLAAGAFHPTVET